MPKEQNKRVAECIRALSAEMTRMRDAMDTEPDPDKANALSHDVSQLWVIIQSLMAL